MTLNDLTLDITESIDVKADIGDVYRSVLHRLGEGITNSKGESMQMTLEQWPGGRWFRDRGNGVGHLWGHVQAIKRPTLLEITGPLFMSDAVVSNVQYRLSEENGATVIRFNHKAFGLIQEEHRKGVIPGWTHINQRIKERAEGKR